MQIHGNYSQLPDDRKEALKTIAPMAEEMFKEGIKGYINIYDHLYTLLPDGDKLKELVQTLFERYNNYIGQRAPESQKTISNKGLKNLNKYDINLIFTYFYRITGFNVISHIIIFINMNSHDFYNPNLLCSDAKKMYNSLINNCGGESNNDRIVKEWFENLHKPNEQAPIILDFKQTAVKVNMFNPFEDGTFEKGEEGKNLLFD